MGKLGVSSSTGNFSEANETLKDTVQRYLSRLPYVNASTGLLVAIGSRFLSLDIFDKGSTCQEVWERVISGAVVEALPTENREEAPSLETTEEFIRKMRVARWDKVEPIGDGTHFRTKESEGLGSALFFEALPVHISYFGDPVL
jgi:hypothetical protein